VIWADNSNSTGDNPAGANSTFDIYTAAVRIVVNTPPVLTVPGPQTVDFHDSLTFNVSAMDADAGDTLSFTATGLPAGLSLTDHGNRTATVSGTVTDTPGLFTATITVTDHVNPPVSKTVAITVTREETTTHYTGPFVIANGFPATPSGRLLEDGITPIAGRMLTLTIGPDSCIGCGRQCVVHDPVGVGAARNADREGRIPRRHVLPAVIGDRDRDGVRVP
jgi:hypothetical protein